MISGPTNHSKLLDVDADEFLLNQPSIVNEVNDPPNKVFGTDKIPVEAEHGPFLVLQKMIPVGWL